MEILHATLEERLWFQEAQNNCKQKNTPFKGLVVNKETGKIVENLVIQGGRELALRKLFNLPYSIDGTLANFHLRKIACFAIGSGGTPMGDPGNPIAPTPADTTLNTEIPFFQTSSNSSAIYLDGRTNGLNTDWYKKKFTGSPAITTNSLTDDYYVKMTLSISNTEIRGASLNEIALYSGRETSAGSGVFPTNTLQMFSRLTFPTEFFPLVSSKAIEYDYYLYI